MICLKNSVFFSQSGWWYFGAKQNKWIYCAEQNHYSTLQFGMVMVSYLSNRQTKYVQSLYQSSLISIV